MISEIEMFCADADLLAVKAEKLHDFRFLTESNQQKKFADEKQKEVTELPIFKEVLFIYKFICRVSA